MVMGKVEARYAKTGQPSGEQNRHRFENQPSSAGRPFASFIDIQSRGAASTPGGLQRHQVGHREEAVTSSRAATLSHRNVPACFFGELISVAVTFVQVQLLVLQLLSDFFLAQGIMVA